MTMTEATSRSTPTLCPENGVYDERFAREVAEFLMRFEERWPSIPTILFAEWQQWAAWAKAFLEERHGE